MPPLRPVLKPALRRLWRDPSTLQLGVEPRRAVVLHGLEPADTQALGLLDGSRDLGAVVTDAGTAGCAPDRVAHLVSLLTSADLLDAAPAADPRLEPDLLSLSLLHPGYGAAGRVLDRRRAATIAIHGAGRVGATIASLLAAAGIGTLHVVDPAPPRAADVAPGGIRSLGHGSRATAVTQPLRRAGRAVTTDADAPADLVVVAPTGGAPSPETAARVRHRVHLLAVVRETVAAVGPLVLPGETACLRCGHLARLDRDPQWASLAAQVAGEQRDVEACDVVLATLAASLTALQVLAWVDEPQRRPPTAGGVLEFDLADGRLRRRSLHPHPSCGCGAGGPGATMEE
jgi:bacteriocin biosynthesis cyclodehydratase domain-containing protein